MIRFDQDTSDISMITIEDYIQGDNQSKVTVDNPLFHENYRGDDDLFKDDFIDDTDLDSITI
jgi:hypothetical protein